MDITPKAVDYIQDHASQNKLEDPILVVFQQVYRG
jgi:hypothetical protein